MRPLTGATRAWLTRSVKPFRFTGGEAGAPDFRDTRGLGLYVHIPFCRTLCAFCPYCKVVYQPDAARAYLAALLREIDLTGATLHGKKKTATSLYFGGGTPALLAGEIGTIIRRLERYFTITGGIGVELHPGDVTARTLRVLKAAGVTKISIGVQSFQPESLRLLGREGGDFGPMFDALAREPFETVSMDFIFALPGQTVESLRQDIETAFSHGANHAALYPFVDFTFTSRGFSKMSERGKKRLLYGIVDECAKKGYARDSIWTFSKDGASRYSSMTRDNFLGFGCSATTLLEDSFRINTFDVAAYCRRLEEGRLPTALTLRFTRRQRMVYYLFWTAYTMRVDPAAFEAFFGVRLERAYGFELTLARLLGFVRREDGKYVMTKRGSYYYHYYEQFYTLSYIDHMWGLMRNTAFPEELVIR